MQKFTLLFLLPLLIAATSMAQSVGIGTTSPNSSAMLDVSSTTKGLLLPRMTSAQRTAIASPANGLIVYDTDTKTVWYHNGSSWTNMIAGGGGGFSLPFNQTVNMSGTVFQIDNTGTANTMTVGSTGGIGLNAYSTNAAAINANSTNGFGIITTSFNSNALHAFSNNANNTLPTIRANNTGGGVGIHASAVNDNGVFATSSAVSKAAVRGESSSVAGDGVLGINTAGGVGVRAHSNTGTGLSAYSTSGTGISTNSISGLALNVSGNLKISGGNTNPSAGAVLTSDANGNATWKKERIAFRCYGLFNEGWGVIPQLNQSAVGYGKVEEYDYSNSFTPATNNNYAYFTAPINGLYHFDVSARWDADDFSVANIDLMLIRNGVESVIAYSWLVFDEVHVGPQNQVSTDVKLQAGDKVYVRAYQFNDIVESGPEYNRKIGNVQGTYFGGHLVFAD